MSNNIPKTPEKLIDQDILASGLYSFDFKPISFHSTDRKGNDYVADSVSIQNEKTKDRAVLHFRRDSKQLVWAVRDAGPHTFPPLSFIEKLDASPESKRTRYYQRSTTNPNGVHELITDETGRQLCEKRTDIEHQNVTDYFDYIDPEDVMQSLAKVVSSEVCPESLQPYKEKILGYFDANLDKPDNHAAQPAAGLIV